MANIHEPSRNSDPSIEKSEEQVQRVEERLNNLTLNECISLASNEEDNFVRLYTAKAICKLTLEIEHEERLNIFKKLIDSEKNEWVYHEYLYFLFSPYGQDGQDGQDYDTAEYHDRLDQLKQFSNNSGSDLKRWLATQCI